MYFDISTDGRDCNLIMLNTHNIFIKELGKISQRMVAKSL